MVEFSKYYDYLGLRHFQFILSVECIRSYITFTYICKKIIKIH